MVWKAAENISNYLDFIENFLMMVNSVEGKLI